MSNSTGQCFKVIVVILTIAFVKCSVRARLCSKHSALHMLTCSHNSAR